MRILELKHVLVIVQLALFGFDFVYYIKHLRQMKGLRNRRRTISKSKGDGEGAVDALQRYTFAKTLANLLTFLVRFASPFQWTDLANTHRAQKNTNTRNAGERAETKIIELCNFPDEARTLRAN